ncbi:hypothetical protein CDD80_4295 [Ophiocordyceps camponoti-rufipedis]|uniref:DUF676 domain-containing protein n=1 Tax=Ophiocordyceps camponoti-rufipedis TaxID=2004952 RepID=A0A2C5Z0B3_9HYPO|nr:hypothetical protein CDD80_4295 [Ophiocordyceps camponoti-rufipedis]
MLLLHQVGSVKIGDVVRYTVSYTPSQDRILPAPEKLHVRIRNTSTIVRRAAFVRGPYTLSVAAYPAGFDPNAKFENPRRYGVPVFEPMLKAGGSWECELVVPDDIRQTAGAGDSSSEAASWVIEVASQVIFSTSVAVGYELVVARDAKSLNLTTAVSVGQSQLPLPGRVSDYQQSIATKDGSHHQLRGVFSRAVHLKVEDTATLWNTPRLPEGESADEAVEKTDETETKTRRKTKVHLVVLTHGLHSNLGADMLYLKESIDAAAKQAKQDARARRRAGRRRSSAGRGPADDADGDKTDDDDDDDDDDEQVIVRGYSGNATKTERGIKYLGKRLARYVLSMTYPDQPLLPIGKGSYEGYSQGTNGHARRQSEGKHESVHPPERAFRISSISFIGHSLGGLVQMYAVAYIQKHSPQFFDLIRPINFIALATPFLGLSNENPLYVRFALDFGLVGRSGQDMGLTWRAPTIARSGWGAIVSNLGESAHRKVYGDTVPESKPLLRILPTGPAHTALNKFRYRTLYSNVVNDGIVPLRTSCLLFLDWQGLGRVEKARRDAGLVQTVVGFGWAELTGATMLVSRPRQLSATPEAGQQTDSGASTPRGAMLQVPQPSDEATDEDDRASLASYHGQVSSSSPSSSPTNAQTGPLAGFFKLFQGSASNEPAREKDLSQKQKMILRRGQTMPLDQAAVEPSDESSSTTNKVTAGDSLDDGQVGVIVKAPPRTTFFESAGDLLNPSLPDVEYLVDPTKRPRAIFHDRIYHPSDIPPPPAKRRQPSNLMRRKRASAGSGSTSPVTNNNQEDSDGPHQEPTNNNSPSASSAAAADVVRVEEKIARGYHRDLSWRKVLVKLEPDAHNNILVRRMFPNAFGWPVIKHLVDAHFSHVPDSPDEQAGTDKAAGGERALDMSKPPDEHGVETVDINEARDELEGGFGYVE